MTNYSIIPGILSGITSVSMNYPFETIKSNIQINPSYNFRETIKNIYKKNGINGFFRGYPLPLILISFKKGYQYSIFEYLNNNNINSYFTGFLIGISGTMINCPINIVQVNMQNSINSKYKNTLDCIKKIYKDNKLKSFYKGFKINVFKDSIYSGIYLGTYSYLRRNYSNKCNYCFFYGGISSLLSWIFIYPIDVINTNIQIDKQPNKEMLKFLMKYRFKILRGMIPILLRTVPSNACSMYVYEKSKNLLI